jgi:hypothetical protein
LEWWRALLARFASSGQTVAAFCQHESVSPASFYRWRSLLGPGSVGDPGPVASALPLTKTGFVDLGPLIATESSRPHVELYLDLGGGLMLHLVRR